MIGPVRTPLETSPTDPTLDGPARGALSLSAHPPRCGRVALIEGTGPQITSETETLLRQRLRAASLMLFIGFSAFFVWSLFRVQSRTPIGEFLLGFHFVIDLLFGATFVLLCKKCPIPMKRLRVHEFIVFGTPVIFLLLVQHEHIRECAERGYLPNTGAIWLALIFTYALFIPNTWRRAAVAVGLMAAAPVLLMAYMYFQPDVCATLLHADSGVAVQLAIMMGAAFITSVYGTHTIGALRREAFEARQLGQYRLCRLIGSGGMGEVYLAEHQLMKRPCAIKLIRPNKAHDPQALARFEREVRATARLSHWNTVEIFDYGRAEDGTFYYVMEYLPGLSLAELVERHGPLPAARVIHLLVQTCDALGEAHAAGLIHRDIKPGNIFAAQRGGIFDVAKLLDFGLAKPIIDRNESVQLTQDGSITGSPLYMSPEQATGESEPDARSDIYSLGALAYYLLTGVPPFAETNTIRAILAHAQQTVVPPSQLRADVPADVEAVVLRCLAKSPGERYQDAASLAAALLECAAAGNWSRDDAAQWWHDHEARDKQVEACAEAAF